MTKEAVRRPANTLVSSKVNSRASSPPWGTPHVPGELVGSVVIGPPNANTLQSRLPNKNYGTLGIHSL